MSNPDLRAAAAQLKTLVASVGDGDLERPTPCPAYRVGDLVEHIGGLALAFRFAAEKSGGGDSAGAPAGDASRLGDDWRTRIPADLDALGAAWLDPAAWTGFTSAGSIDMPGEIAGQVALEEIVVHGWDLARSIGAPFTADDGDLEVVRQLVAGFPPESRGDAFGQPVDVSDGAPLLDRVVALTGRDPSWSA